MIEELKAIYQEIAAKKRAEFEAALKDDEVGDPVSIGISIAISVALSAGSYLVMSALAPKPPRQQQGKMSGSLQLMNSEQGIFIPEIYGAGPTISLVAGSNPTWQNLTNTTGGANGSITKTGGANDAYNAGASHDTAVTAGDAFIEVIVGTGAATAGFSTTDSPTDDADMLFGVQWHHLGTIEVKTPADPHVEIGHWTAGDKFRIEIRNGRFRLYKNSAELSSLGVPAPAVVYPLHFGIAMYKSGAGVSNTKVQIGNIGEPPNAGRGGIKVPAMIVWTSGIRKNVTVTQQPVRGGKGGGARSQTVENTSYDIDLRLNFARGPLALIREYANADINLDQYAQSTNPTGVHDPTIPADDPYDPADPPDPQPHYPIPYSRVDGEIAFDGDNTGTGSIQGGGSLFAIYEGNATQEPDPTEESDIDAKYGSGSTTAYRETAGIVHKQFDLSRWSGIVPNFTAVWEHTELKTLDDIYGSLCERVGVLAANDDYDFSGIEISSRGMLIAGRLFQPAEVIGSPEIELTYNYFATEVEGQIVGFTEGDEPELEIDDTEVGWLDGETDVPDIIPEVESVLASEIALPREVIVKFIDPDKEWDANTQSAKRQVTEGKGTDVLEVQLALLTDEARSVAQRKLYRDYVAGTAHKFTLPWTYLYLHPGYKIIINRAEGFTHTLRLTSITGGIGVLDCEGIALEPEVFNQPATGTTGIPGNPPQMIPAMTIMSLLDTPLLREEDEGKVGWYVVGTPRTGFNQSWQGFVLVMQKNNEWGFKAESKLPGTIGTIVSATSLSTDPNTLDTVGEIVVDLYGTTQTLSSVADVDIANNEALAGNMLFNFADATQEAGFPNRWTLTTLLNGQRGTDPFISDVVAGNRFVVINEAVKFVPMDLADLNVEYDYRAVTIGQSLDDAATIPATWTGGLARPRKVISVSVYKDASDYWLIQAIGNPRASEKPEEYELLLGLNSEDWETDEAANTVLTLPMVTGTIQGVMFAGTTGDFGAHQEMWIDIVSVLSTGTSVVVVTAAGMTGSPVTVNFPVATSESAVDAAANLAAALSAETDITDFFSVGYGSGSLVILSTLVAAANDVTMDFSATRLDFGLGGTDGDSGTSNHAYRNNVATFEPSGGFVATSIQAFEQDFQRFEFEPSIDYFDSGLSIAVVGSPAYGDGFGVGIEIRANAAGGYPIPDDEDLPLSFNWTIPADYAFPEGTVQETWYHYGVAILTRDGVDPGRNPFVMTGREVDNYLGADGRPGPRYVFEINGNELTAKDKKTGTQIAKVSLGEDIPYPMRLSTWTTGSTGCYLRNAFFGGNIFPSTILAYRDQVNPDTWGEVQLTLYGLVRQRSRILGVKGEPFKFEVSA